MSNDKIKNDRQVDLEFLEDIFFQSRAPKESVDEIELTPAEKRQLKWLREKFTQRNYTEIIKMADSMEIPDADTLVYAAMSVRANAGLIDESLKYLFKALEILGNSDPPYLRTSIYNQIAVDLYSKTKDYRLAKAIALEAIHNAPDGRLRAWSAWTTLAELMLLECFDTGGNFNTVLAQIDSIFQDLLSKYNNWDKDIDFTRYIKRQAQLEEYRTSKYYLERFAKILN